MGKAAAPFFAIGLVVFLLAFVGYMICALVALVFDVQVFFFPSGLCRLHDLCAGGMEFTVHGLYIKNKDSFLNLDVQAMDEECAEETWVWIYVFIVLAVPTIIGSILKSTLYTESYVVNILGH